MRKSGAAVTSRGVGAAVAMSKKRKRASEDEDVIKAEDVLTDSDGEVNLSYRSVNTTTSPSYATPSPTKFRRTRRILPKPDNLKGKQAVKKLTTASFETSAFANQENTVKSLRIKLTYNTSMTKQAMIDLGLSETDTTRMIMVRKSTLDDLKRENEMLKENNVNLNERNNEMSKTTRSAGIIENVSTNCYAHPQCIQESRGVPFDSQLPSPSLISTSPLSAIPTYAPVCPLPYTTAERCQQDASSNMLQFIGATGATPFTMQLLAVNQVLERRLHVVSAQVQAMEQKVSKLEEDNETLALSCLEFARLELVGKEGKKIKSKNT